MCEAVLWRVKRKGCVLLKRESFWREGNEGMRWSVGGFCSDFFNVLKVCSKFPTCIALHCFVLYFSRTWLVGSLSGWKTKCFIFFFLLMGSLSFFLKTCFFFSFFFLLLLLFGTKWVFFLWVVEIYLFGGKKFNFLGVVHWFLLLKAYFFGGVLCPHSLCWTVWNLVVLCFPLNGCLLNIKLELWAHANGRGFI